MRWSVGDSVVVGGGRDSLSHTQTRAGIALSTAQLASVTGI